MKKIWKYIVVSLAGLSMLACAKEVLEPSVDGNAAVYTYTIAIDESTKSYLDGDHIAWESGDGVSWFAQFGSYTSTGYSQIVMGDPRTFTVNSPVSIDVGGHVYACAQCYGISYSGTAQLYIPEWQDGVITNSMPMVSLPVEVTQRIQNYTQTPIGTAQFVNLGAVIEYNVFTTNSSYSGEQVTGVKFESDSPIAGSFDVDLTTVSESAIPAPSGLGESKVFSELTAPVTVGDSKADGIKVYQVVAPGTWSGTVTVFTDAASYSYPVSSREFKRNKFRTLNIDLASSTATRLDNSAIEGLLTSRSWVLSSVTQYESDVTEGAGNSINFNADHSYVLDCSASGDKVFDYYFGNGWVDPDYYTLSGATQEWSVSMVGASHFLNFTPSAYPLVIVDDISYDTYYEIVTLNQNSLVLYSQMYDYTISFTAGAETLESQLAKTWTLSSVTVNGWDGTHSAGDSMTLNLDGSFSFDCSAHNNQVYDYYYTWDWGYPDLSHLGDGNLWEGQTLQWSVSEIDGTRYLNFSECAYPLVILGNCRWDPISYEIVSLSKTSLVLHYAGMNEFTVCFTAPGTNEDAAALLTANQWAAAELLVDYMDDGNYYDADLSSYCSLGNKISFNADYTLSFDCSANGGCTDNFIDGCIIHPESSDIAQMSWSLENNGTTLVFSAGSYPVVVVNDINGSSSCSILKLDGSELILACKYYTHNAKLRFTAV